MLALTAAELFFATANASASYYAQAPTAYLRYRVHSDVRVIKHNRQYDRDVLMRTVDQVATVSNPEDRSMIIAEAFPVQPNLNPVSTFTYIWQSSLTGHNVKSRVKDIVPFRYDFAQPDADVIVRSSKDYSITYAETTDPSVAHLRLQATDLLKAHAKLRISDLYIDTGDMVTIGADYEQPYPRGIATLQLRYVKVGDTRLLSTLHYHAEGAIALTHITADYIAYYKDYEFLRNAPLSFPWARTSVNLNCHKQ